MLTSTEFLSNKGIKTIKSEIPTALVREYLIEFAKLHVQEALQSVDNKIDKYHLLRNTHLDDGTFIDDCYPLTNIK